MDRGRHIEEKHRSGAWKTQRPRWSSTEWCVVGVKMELKTGGAERV